MKLPRQLTTTTSTQLVSMCNQMRIKLNYIGFKDELPKYIVPGCYIINMENDLPGSHWVCIICCERHACYIDSYGQAAANEVHEFIQTRYKTYFCNTRQLQDVQSNACGYYAIAACCYFTTYCKSCADFRRTVDTFLHWFNGDNQKNNDKVLKNVLTQMF